MQNLINLFLRVNVESYIFLGVVIVSKKKLNFRDWTNKLGRKEYLSPPSTLMHFMM